MSILAWLGLTTPPDNATADTHAWLAADRDARAETSAREQLAAAQCREAAARYELRERNRMYGRASATIGAQRNLIARLRGEVAAISGPCRDTAHARTGVGLDECVCGYESPSAEVHRRHVAEQLAAVGALGTFAPMAAPPVLVDRDGDEWLPHPDGNGYFHPGNHLSFMPSREALAEEYGPLTEKPAHPAPRPTARTGSFRLGPARGLADGG